ncbi:MAG: glycosyltransferase [Bacteroidetes bacterium]|nr:glycosyltransferase [Bacteroidota bacterium]
MRDGFLISVIIPAYNAGKYIEETIRSVLKQTHSDLELIVVNDGSTDTTSKLVEAICKNDPRIKLINQNNAGVSVARNTGFAVSKGSYIAYLDSDDIWLPNFLELMLLKFSFDDALGLVHCDNQIIDGDSQKKKEVNRGEEGYILEHLLLGGEGKYIFSISGVLIKREVIESVGGFDPELSNGADHEFYFRIANRYRIGRVPTVALYYRIHSGNMHSNIHLLEKDTLKAYRKADEYKLFKNAFFRRRCYSNMYLILAGSFWKNEGGKIKGGRYILKSILAYPPNILKLLKKLL